MFNSLTTNTVLPTFGGDQDDNNGRTQNMAINYTHIITPTWVVNGLAAWDRFFETEEFGSTGDSNYNIACGLMKLPGVSCTPYNYGAPSISNGFTNFTNRTNGPRTRLNQLWDFDVKSSIQKAKHLIKFGARAYKYNWTFNEALYPRGVYTFSGTETLGAQCAGGVPAVCRLPPGPLQLHQCQPHVSGGSPEQLEHGLLCAGRLAGDSSPDGELRRALGLLRAASGRRQSPRVR